MLRRFLPLLALALASVVVTGWLEHVRADRSPEPKASAGDAGSFYARGLELLEDEEYEKARQAFETALREKKNDPDILNMLAYTKRLTGDLKGAFETYEKAIQKRPRFPQAREYLGEAHLEAVMREVLELESYGPDGSRHLAALVDAFAAAAERAAVMRPDVKPAAKWGEE